MTYSGTIDKKYLQSLQALDLPSREPRSEWVILHKQGDGKRASTKFNFQVYTNSRGVLRLVTNDFPTLQRLLEGRGEVSEEGKRIVLMDDSGWGFPIGGVLCGAYDFQTGRFYWREVEVEYFQGERFQNKAYLARYRDRALEIVHEINPSLEETIIKICTGYINTRAKEALRQGNFFIVEVAQIEEPLQTLLERQNKEYVRALVGKDVYYDPKGMPTAEVARRYREVVSFAQRMSLMHIVKTGWKSFQEMR